MSFNKLRFAGLAVLMCSFVALPAQESTTPPSLLPIPAPQPRPVNVGTDSALVDVPQSPTFVPRGQNGIVPLAITDKPQQPPSIGAIWDRQVQALEAKDNEIRKVEDHLNQLRKQRSELAATLAETARKLAPMVRKAQEATDGPSFPPTTPPPLPNVNPEPVAHPAKLVPEPARTEPKPNAELAKPATPDIDKVLEKLQSIESRLKAPEKPVEPKLSADRK